MQKKPPKNKKKKQKKNTPLQKKKKKKKFFAQLGQMNVYTYIHALLLEKQKIGSPLIPFLLFSNLITSHDWAQKIHQVLVICL